MEIKFALSRIDQIYIDFFKRDFKDFTRCKRIDFEYNSYSRWALNELRQYIIKNRNKDPIDSLNEFKYKMDQFACQSKSEANFIFSVAYDITVFVIDELMTYETY